MQKISESSISVFLIALCSADLHEEMFKLEMDELQKMPGHSYNVRTGVLRRTVFLVEFEVQMSGYGWKMSFH